MAIKLLMGLRNPGAAYEQTRHNAGEWWIRALISRYGGVFKQDKKLHCSWMSIAMQEQPCKLMLATTFMNHSGLALRELSQFFKVEPAEILVAHDDLDLPAGKIKLKTGGGARWPQWVA